VSLWTLWRCAACANSLALMSMTVACGGDGLDARSSAAITVDVTTAGISLDPNGYTATLDGGQGRSVAVHDAVAFTGLPAGDHTVLLSGLSPNCAARGPNPLTITTQEGGVTARIVVECQRASGSITLNLRGTVGAQITASLSTGVKLTRILPGTATFTDLADGPYQIGLEGSGPSALGACFLESGRLGVDVTNGAAATALVSVECIGPIPHP
jgi:hypothetical protein